MGSPRWRRNRRLKCVCTGYWFPHRRGGGACEHSRTCDLHRARRSGDAGAVLDAEIELALVNSTALPLGAPCPF